ncbi:hypothetical protein LTR10_003974 [Elasticomyces elasticus]|nr:hypothetical protein LTR10_003974 [Elasticomyces elasticus]KAK4977838.1 hypothetical protein LTR42_002213 [Elasticomyces elasticus]
MPPTQTITILRITRVVQTVLAAGIGIIAAGFSLKATLADSYPHSVFYAVFTNGFIGLSCLVINCLIVAETRQTDQGALYGIDILKASVATCLWFFSVEHLPWSLNMEDAGQKWNRSLIGGLIVVSLFYIPLCIRYCVRGTPAVAEHEENEKPEADENSKVAL